MLGVIDAVLGRKEEALREGRRAVELVPMEKDAVDGKLLIEYFAMIAAWVGEKDLACQQLAIANRPPSAFSYGGLKCTRGGMRCAASRASKHSSLRSRQSNSAMAGVRLLFR